MKCKECEYWQPLENDSSKSTCEYSYKKSVHYYGYTNENDYCTKFSQKKVTQ